MFQINISAIFVTMAFSPTEHHQSFYPLFTNCLIWLVASFLMSLSDGKIWSWILSLLTQLLALDVKYRCNSLIVLLPNIISSLNIRKLFMDISRCFKRKGNICRGTHCSYEYIISRKEIIKTKKNNLFTNMMNLCLLSKKSVWCAATALWFLLNSLMTMEKLYFSTKRNQMSLCLMMKLYLHALFFFKMRKFNPF